MDQKFNSDLQTHIQKLGRNGGKFGPPTSQDPMDARLHEVFIADTAYRIFGQRRKDAHDVIFELKRAEVERAVVTANKLMTAQTEQLFQTEHYSLTFQAKKPVTRLDDTKLRVELLKAGVSEAVLDDAWAKSEKLSAPARVLMIATTHERGS